MKLINSIAIIIIKKYATSRKKKLANFEMRPRRVRDSKNESAAIDLRGNRCSRAWGDRAPALPTQLSRALRLVKFGDVLRGNLLAANSLPGVFDVFQFAIDGCGGFA